MLRQTSKTATKTNIFSNICHSIQTTRNDRTNLIIKQHQCIAIHPQTYSFLSNSCNMQGKSKALDPIVRRRCTTCSHLCKCQCHNHNKTKFSHPAPYPVCKILLTTRTFLTITLCSTLLSTTNTASIINTNNKPYSLLCRCNHHKVQHNKQSCKSSLHPNRRHKTILYLTVSLKVNVLIDVNRNS